MDNKVKYPFSAEVWRHSSPGGWYFVSLPKKLAKEIREHLKWQEEGWGRLKVMAKIGASEWDTAIWFDTKKKTYLLPLKADIRKKERLETGRKLDVSIWV